MAIQKSIKVTFSRWMLVSLAIYAVGLAILLGFIGLALNLSFRSLLLPYCLLLYALLMAAVFVYWARAIYVGSRSWAFRLGLAVFFSSLLFTSAVAISIYTLRIVSRQTIIVDFLPCILPSCALAAVAVYVALRRRGVRVIANE